MYRTQCPDVGQAAWPKPMSLSARGLHNELGESTTQTDASATGGAGLGALRACPISVILRRDRQERTGASLKSWLSKLVLFVQTLLLLLAAPMSASAANEADQEIGVPQPMETRAKGCFGVVLSPDGDGFYSVRDGLLSHYQIDPFKKTASVNIDEAQLKDIPEKTECRVLIMDDRSKLILVFREWLVVLDRRTGEINKKLKREGALERAGSEASTLNGDDLVFLGRARDATFRLTVVDARTLQLKKQISDVRAEFGLMTSNDSSPFMARIENRLYLSSGRSLVVLNGKTYEPESALTSIRGQVYGIKISKDYKKLYLHAGRFVTDHLSGLEKDYGEAVEDSTAVFDQETRQVSFERIDFNKARYQREQFDPMLFAPSRNSDYVANRPSWNPYVILGRRATNITYLFYQYESGEAILTKLQPGGRGRIENFQLTPGARQHLVMKDRTGKLVPINDATFAKYHTNSAR